MREAKVACSVVLSVLLVSACGRPTALARVYEVRGQVLAVAADQGTVTLRHDDIKGFMPAMTMPFKVQKRSLLSGIARGDLVTATLAVTDSDAYLTRLDRVGHSDVSAASAPAPEVAVLSAGAEVRDGQLRDADGRTFFFSSLRGKTVALAFIYTRCPLPQFCPLMDRQFATLRREVSTTPSLRNAVQLLSISFDPEYDTLAVLSAHARGVGADGRLWKFVTADRPTIDAFAPQFGVAVSREEGGLITHNLRTAIVDRAGRLVKIYEGTEWTVDELVADLKTATAASAK